MNDPGIDLTGKLIIKVALGDDIRRILITNEDITYDELVLMMQRVYRGKLSSSDDIVIKYKDEDNDLITIFDSSDLNFAIQCSRILKITLFVNGKPEPLQTDEVKMIKGELKHIRNRCNELLDKLDSREPSADVSTTVDSSTSRLPPSKVSESPQMSPRPGFAPPTSQAKSKEFDPLSSQKSVEEAQNKVMSSFGISNDVTERSGTPDSISSIGSSSNRKLPQGRATPQQQGGKAVQPAPEGTPSGKVPPWQNQQPVAPSPYSMDPQAYSPAIMMAQNFPVPCSISQNAWAGKYGPHEFNSYQRSLMQSHMFTGHEHSEANESVIHKPKPSYVSSPATQAGYPPQGQVSHVSQAQPASTQYGAGYQPQAQPGQQPAHPGTQPAHPGPQMSPQQQGYQQQGYGMMPAQQMHGQQQQIQQAQAQQAPYPSGFPSQQPQQMGQQPQQVGQPGAVAAPGQGPSSTGNPYARQGPGYGAGYPRPAGTYPQGYQ